MWSLIQWPLIANCDWNDDFYWHSNIIYMLIFFLFLCRDDGHLSFKRGCFFDHYTLTCLKNGKYLGFSFIPLSTYNLISNSSLDNRWQKKNKKKENKWPNNIHIYTYILRQHVFLFFESTQQDTVWPLHFTANFFFNVTENRCESNDSYAHIKPSRI